MWTSKKPMALYRNQIQLRKVLSDRTTGIMHPLLGTDTNRFERRRTSAETYRLAEKIHIIQVFATYVILTQEIGR